MRIRLSWLSTLAATALVASCSKTPPESKPKAEPSVGAARPARSFLALGSTVPRVSAPDQTGAPRNLREFAGKPLVVYFYPKDDTPGCTVEAQEIRDVYEELRATGAQVVGISMDDSTSHKAFADKHSLPFVLLADPDQELAQAFGVPLNDKGRTQRTTFVFGADGRLKKVFESVTPSGHGRELISELQKVGN